MSRQENPRNEKLLKMLRKQTEVSLAMYVENHMPIPRELVGKERDHMLVLLKLLEPTFSTNNQRTSTDYYVHNSKYYSITYGLGELLV